MIISTELYAKALYEIATESKKELEFYHQTLSMQTILADKQILGLMSQNVLDISAVWETLGTYYDREIVSLVQILQEENVLSHFGRIVDEIRSLLIRANLLSSVVVNSAFELEDDKKTSILNVIKERYNGELEVSYKLDSSLISGVKITVNNDVYDTTLKNKLELLRGGQSL